MYNINPVCILLIALGYLGFILASNGIAIIIAAKISINTIIVLGIILVCENR